MGNGWLEELFYEIRKRILFLEFESAKREGFNLRNLRVQSDKDGEVNNIAKDIEVENLKCFFGEDTMARFLELAEAFEELEKITSHKEIVRKIADFF